MLSLFKNHRHILLQLSKRYIQERYRGSILGIVWSLINPLLMLAIYTLVFTVIFEARIPIETSHPFALWLFVGLILHMFFMECLSQATTIITRNSNYVKKVIFPLNILVPAITISALFQLVIGITILLAATSYLGYTIPLTIIFVPVILVPFIILTVGISWFIASIGVFIRDITHIIGLLGTVLFFISTILIPPKIIPELYRPLIYLNPLSYVTDFMREVVIMQQVPVLEHYLVFCAISVLIGVSGYLWFEKTKKGFADVL